MKANYDFALVPHRGETKKKALGRSVAEAGGSVRGEGVRGDFRLARVVVAVLVDDVVVVVFQLPLLCLCHDARATWCALLRSHL